MPTLNLGKVTGATGPAGPQGPQGQAGEDALWNFVGPYSSGASYAVGDVATYNGETFYRTNANGGNVGDTPFVGSTFWVLLAQKGADGSGSGTGTITSSTTTDLTGFIYGNGTSISANDAPSDNKKYVRRNAQWVEIDFSIPENTAIPTITGTAAIGSTISATNGTWSNTPTFYRYQWQKSVSLTSGWTSITDATNSTLTVIGDFDGFYLRAAVWASNVYGESENPAYSDPTIQVTSDVGLYNGLNAHWKLNESTGTRFDSHGPFDMTDHNGAGSSTGIIGDSVLLQGTFQQNLRTTQNPFPNNSQVSINCWAKLTTDNIYNFVIDSNTGINWVGGGFGLYLVNSIFQFVILKGSEIDQINISSSVEYVLDQWHMITGVASTITGEMKLYVDGTLAAYSDQLGSNPILGDFTNMLAIGSNADGTFGFFDGQVDEVSLWGRALTDAEVTLLYNNGSGLPYEQF
jgi:hypothetical protein